MIFPPVNLQFALIVCHRFICFWFTCFRITMQSTILMRKWKSRNFLISNLIWKKNLKLKIGMSGKVQAETRVKKSPVSCLFWLNFFPGKLACLAVFFHLPGVHNQLRHTQVRFRETGGPIVALFIFWFQQFFNIFHLQFINLQMISTKKLNQ